MTPRITSILASIEGIELLPSVSTLSPQRPFSSASSASFLHRAVWIAAALLTVLHSQVGWAEDKPNGALTAGSASTSTRAGADAKSSSRSAIDKFPSNEQPAGPNVIKAGEFLPVSIVFKSFSRAPLIKLGDLQRTLDTRLAKNTELQTLAVADQEIQHCQEDSKFGRMQCLVRAARTDYNDADAIQARSFGELRERLREKRQGARTANYLLVVLARSTSDGERVQIFQVDTRRALEAIFEMVKGAEGITPSAIDKTEGKIIASAIGTSGQFAGEVKSLEEFDSLMGRAYAQLIEPWVKSGGHAARFARIRVKNSVPGAVLSIDGRGLGALPSGETVVTQLQPKAREVRIEQSRYEMVSTTIKLGVDQEVLFTPRWVRIPNQLAVISQRSAIWGGTALAVTGAVILGLSFAMQGPDRLCFGKPEPECGEARFGRFGDDRTEIDRINGVTQAPPRDGSIPIAPIGYSLLGAGAIWAIGTLIWSDDEHVPWIELLTGLLVGGTSFGVSYALGG